MALLKRGKHWAPFRSVASWYLWRAVDLANAAARGVPSSLQ
jgi:DNA-3-methyladenine glycosylase II